MAIPLPEPSRLEVSILQTKLKALSLPIIWELPEKLHITLHFLGKIDDASLFRLKSDLAPIISNLTPPTITLEHLGYLYKKHGDSLIYLSVGPLAEIRNIERQIRTSLKEHDYSPPSRYFPHVTIGRLKRLRHPNQVKDALYSLPKDIDHPLPPFPATGVAIYQSSYWARESTSQYQVRAFMDFAPVDRSIS